MKALKRLLTTTLKLAVFAGIIAGGYYGYQTYMVEPEEDTVGELPTAVRVFSDDSLNTPPASNVTVERVQR